MLTIKDITPRKITRNLNNFDGVLLNKKQCYELGIWLSENKKPSESEILPPFEKAMNVIREEFPDAFIKSRKRKIVDLRRMIFSYVFSNFNTTKTRIATIFNQDHSTIVHSISQHNNYYLTDKMYQNEYIIFSSKLAKLCDTK